MKQQQMKRALLAVLVSGIFLPFGVQAADADLSFPLFFVFQPIGIMPLIAAHAES
ncbi:MAG: hypothetical protein Q8L56_04455 [Rhodocyclaceae bacterium]|nr:hypothetical protein [Rhodocyclaceae bacterium]